MADTIVSDDRTKDDETKGRLVVTLFLLYYNTPCTKMRIIWLPSPGGAETKQLPADPKVAGSNLRALGSFS